MNLYLLRNDVFKSSVFSTFPIPPIGEVAYPIVYIDNTIKDELSIQGGFIIPEGSDFLDKLEEHSDLFSVAYYNEKPVGVKYGSVEGGKRDE